MQKNTKINNPFALIIFGASGDLAKLKLFPAIYDLAEKDLLPEHYYIIGFARTEKSRKEFQKEFKESLKPFKTDRKIVKKLLDRIHYFSGHYDKLEDYKELRKSLKEITGNPNITKLAYFSVPPQVFKPIIENLGKTKNEKEDLRLIIEKPFGEDTGSAKELFHFVARYFSEECVYLLDHYLGKTSVQSILHLRHQNRILNHMMKGPEIAKIEINALEDIGVEERVGYFNQVGTIKDMVQSHLLQILALITMSIPITEDAAALHREKENILSALTFPATKNSISLGKYQSYKNNTETYVALKLFIDRESWYKTPIYIRTGKMLNKKHTYIVIELEKFAFQPKNEEPNRIIIELQPEERFSMRLVDKTITSGEPKECPNCLPEHAMLLSDVISKKRKNFLSFPEIIASWQITDQVTNFINKQKIKPKKYQDHSEGPTSAEKLNNWYRV